MRSGLSLENLGAIKVKFVSKNFPGDTATKHYSARRYRLSGRPLVFPHTPYLWHLWSDQAHISHVEQAEAQV